MPSSCRNVCACSWTDSKATHPCFVSARGSRTSRGVVSGTVVAPKTCSRGRRTCTSACVNFVRFATSTKGTATTPCTIVETVLRTHVVLELDLLQRTLVPCLGFVSCFASFLHLFLLPTFLSIHVRRACSSSTCRNCAMKAPPIRRSPSRRRARSPPLRFGPVIFSQKISISISPSLPEISMGSIGAVRVVLVQLSNGIFDTAQRHRRVSKHAKEGQRWRWRVS